MIEIHVHIHIVTDACSIEAHHISQSLLSIQPDHRLNGILHSPTTTCCLSQPFLKNINNHLHPKTSLSTSVQVFVDGRLPGMESGILHPTYCLDNPPLLSFTSKNTRPSLHPEAPRSFLIASRGLVSTDCYRSIDRLIVGYQFYGTKYPENAFKEKIPRFRQDRYVNWQPVVVGTLFTEQQIN